MLRISVLAVVAILCAWHAPAPDPRVVAAMLANGTTVSAPVAGAPLADYPDGDYVCPMDSDVRSDAPGNCRRCGMKLVEGVKDLIEYPIDLTVSPAAVRPGAETLLNFGISDPATGKPVRNFETVHEKLYHLFVVSQDLSFFLHTHPERNPDSDFQLRMRFPKPGMYRVLSDFYPAGATPQLITNTVMVPGDGFRLEPARLSADLGVQNGENMRAELAMTPPLPAAGEKVSMFFRVTPDRNIEPYLGAMAHMLAASSDLIDMIHNHPFAATDPAGRDYKLLQFNMTFPRAGVYRVWVQMQRQGVVNTVAFNVPVAARR